MNQLFAFIVIWDIAYILYLIKIIPCDSYVSTNPDPFSSKLSDTYGKWISIYPFAHIACAIFLFGPIANGIITFESNFFYYGILEKVVIITSWVLAIPSLFSHFMLYRVIQETKGKDHGILDKLPERFHSLNSSKCIEQKFILSAFLSCFNSATESEFQTNLDKFFEYIDQYNETIEYQTQIYIFAEQILSIHYYYSPKYKIEDELLKYARTTTPYSVSAFKEIFLSYKEKEFNETTLKHFQDEFISNLYKIM